MQLGAMQDWKLRVTHLLDHAAREHGPRELVSHWADGTESRTTWAGIRRDALKMTQALQRIGIQPGDRIATLAMNHHRHLITWYGAVGAGGILPVSYTHLDVYKRQLKAHPLAYAGFGVALAGLAGALSILFDVPFLTGLWTSFEFDGVGVAVSTPMVFDIGVYFVIFGTISAVALALEDDGGGA